MMFKRKLQGKTNYKKRLQFIISNQPRLVIRKSNKLVYVQVIKYEQDGDKTIASASTKELLKLGYKGSVKSIPSSYLLGLLIANKAKEKSISELVPDLGFHSPVKGSIPFALISGVKDAGINIKIDASVRPLDDRVSGKHIIEQLKKTQKIDPDEFSMSFEQAKRKLTEK